MISGIDHATVLVRDVDAASGAYTRLLGAEPTWRGEHRELGTRSCLFGLFNSLIELVGPVPGDERGAGMSAWLDAHGEGLQALALATDDATACRAQCRARGLRASPVEVGEAHSFVDGSVRTYQSFELSPRDTHGLGVLVVQREGSDVLRRPAGQAGSQAHALDHVVIRTPDPDAMLRLFGEQLGIRLALDRRVGPTRMLFFRVGQVTLEIVHDPGQGGTASLWGLAYRVRAIDGAHARLFDAGLSLSPVREGTKPGTRVFTVRDATCGVPTLVLQDPARDGQSP